MRLDFYSIKMQMTISEIKELVSNQRNTLTDLSVESLSIFGSFARGEPETGSDIDMLVEFSEPVGFFKLFELQDFLKNILGHEIDLNTPNALRDEIREQILKESIRLV